MNPKFMIREGEDAYEYGLRLIETKVEQNPDDLSWEDIVEATGLNCHWENFRRSAVGTPYSGYHVAQYYKKLLSLNGNPESKGDYLEELDRKIAELRKEQRKFFDQRREANKIIDQLGRSENLEDRLVEAAQNLDKLQPLTVKKPNGRSEGVAEAVLVFADWHYGMTADNIWGSYNTDICRQRVESLVERAIERIRHNKCNKLHIVLLGDLCHGAIHTSARVASEELVCNQIIQVSELIAQAISMLADEVSQTIVHATWGNHLRTVQNKNDSIHADNMERLIPWWLKQRLSSRDDILFPNAEYYEFLYFSVCGYNICAAHGDLDNVKSAGTNLNTLFSKRYGRDIDYILLADKHHKEEFEELGIESVIVPCLCGSDDYANSKRLYSTPAQLLMIFQPGIGADACYQIKFDAR